MGEHKEFPEEISDKNKEFVQKLNILHLKSKEETLSSKLEDEVNNLTTPEKEELKKI